MAMTTIMVTGGAGFIGSNFVRYVLRQSSSVRIINLDALTYAGNLENLKAIENDPRYQFVKGDICDSRLVEEIIGGVDAVVHIAAESHVDRSIQDPHAFIRTNVVGTQTLLDAARRTGLKRFLHVSTDEVYGSLGNEGRFNDESPLAPNSPYAASKAASDLFVRAAYHTFNLPVLTTRCTNNYGPYQFPEKLIPLVISNALAGEPIPVYGRGLNVRNWIHVEDHCRGLWAVLQGGRPGSVYNFGSDDELDNLSVIRRILKLMGRSEDLLRFVQDRPGHDFRYSLDSSTTRTELGWSPMIDIDRGLADTVSWYMDNQDWIHNVRNQTYREYYSTQYGVRMNGQDQ